MPRVSALRDSVAPWSTRAGFAALGDIASLPGRAYASLGRPEGEPYADAVARTGPTLAQYGDPRYQGGGDEFSETVLRDPLLPAGVGLGMAARGLGRLGAGLVEGLGNAAGAGAMQYADEGRVSPLGMALAGGMPGLVRAMPKAPARASMISPEERAANFRNWFGDSKVVDEAGNPLTVYHGTSSDFGAFDPKQAGRTYQADKRGIFFAEDPNQAHNAAIDSRFSAGGAESIMPTHLRVERPYSPGITTQQFDEADKAKIFRAAKKVGADGIRLEDGTWIALDPTQIKSATGNRGTFDPNDPNITHLTTPTGRATVANPAQMLGRRLMAGAQQAALRKYLSDDRPQGDTYFTRPR